MSVLFTALINASLLAETLCAQYYLYTLCNHLYKCQLWSWPKGWADYDWLVAGVVINDGIKGQGFQILQSSILWKQAIVLRNEAVSYYFIVPWGCVGSGVGRRFSKTGPHADCSRQCWSSMMKDTWFDCHLPHSIHKLNFCTAKVLV